MISQRLNLKKKKIFLNFTTRDSKLWNRNTREIYDSEKNRIKLKIQFWTPGPGLSNTHRNGISRRKWKKSHPIVHCTLYNVQCTCTMYIYNVHAMTIIKQKPHICEIRNKLHAWNRQ